MIGTVVAVMVGVISGKIPLPQPVSGTIMKVNASIVRMGTKRTILVRKLGARKPGCSPAPSREGLVDTVGGLILEPETQPAREKISPELFPLLKMPWGVPATQ
jgi:hypothetical protein